MLDPNLVGELPSILKDPVVRMIKAPLILLAVSGFKSFGNDQ
jgi:hypothetical protein